MPYMLMKTLYTDSIFSHRDLEWQRSNNISLHEKRRSAGVDILWFTGYCSDVVRINVHL